MKNASDITKRSCGVKNASKIRDLWEKQIYRIKNASFTCPICKEAFTGLTSIGSHLKNHCT